MSSKEYLHMNGGKISIATSMLGVFVILLGLVIDLPRGHVARANTATTSVTVLNTPPQWTNDAYENPTSSTGTPTNIGSPVTWVGSAADSSGDGYFLIICRSSVTPIPRNNGVPNCGGETPGDTTGTSTWAKSGTTTSGALATAATTTVYESQFSPEFINWWAFVCDGNPTGAACNPSSRTGSTSGAIANSNSPFVVNHPPSFTAFYSNSSSSASGIIPGSTGWWYATATDPDTYGGTATDTVILSVCRTPSFNGFDCVSGQQWTATSGNPQANPTTTFAIPVPYPDAAYASYAYIRDSHGNLQSTSSAQQGVNSSFYVNNVAPTIAAASVSLLNATGAPSSLLLTNMATATPGFRVEFVVTDNNSCQTASGTAEIVSGISNIYRSGITQSGCNQSSMFNTNYCYAGGAATTSMWQGYSCVASSTDPCGGTSDPNITWICTFPLWYNADPTDDISQFAGEDWRASAQAADNNFSTSSLVEGTAPREMISAMYYDLQSTSSVQQLIYGGLAPGNNSDPLGVASDTQLMVRSLGNTGIDITLYGGDMCTTFNAGGPNGGCFSGSATSTIAPANQRYATSSVTWALATNILQVSPGVELELDVQKTIATATPRQKMTFWGIAVPGTITQSGDYRGQNTLIGLVGETAFW
jgi:hypothetical protein